MVLDFRCSNSVGASFAEQRRKICLLFWVIFIISSGCINFLGDFHFVQSFYDVILASDPCCNNRLDRSASLSQKSTCAQPAHVLFQWYLSWWFWCSLQHVGDKSRNLFGPKLLSTALRTLLESFSCRSSFILFYSRHSRQSTVIQHKRIYSIVCINEISVQMSKFVPHWIRAPS